MVHLDHLHEGLFLTYVGLGKGSLRRSGGLEGAHSFGGVLEPWRTWRRSV
jgi:hypothetical protein